MHRLALRGSLVLVLVGCGESFSVDDAGDTGVELMDGSGDDAGPPDDDAGPGDAGPDEMDAGFDAGFDAGAPPEPF